MKNYTGTKKTKTETGLIAFYDIWPGNGAGIFLQPRSPHGAHWQNVQMWTVDRDDESTVCLN